MAVSSYRRNLLAAMREREVARVGAEMVENKGLSFRTATNGEIISGKFTRILQLSSGNIAVIEKSDEFSLIRWRLVIDRQLGREDIGVVEGGSVSWQLGRKRESRCNGVGAFFAEAYQSLLKQHNHGCRHHEPSRSPKHPNRRSAIHQVAEQEGADHAA